MRLSLLIEQVLSENPRTTVREIARTLGISTRRCRDELAALAPFGVVVTAGDRVFVGEDHPGCAFEPATALLRSRRAARVRSALGLQAPRPRRCLWN